MTREEAIKILSYYDMGFYDTNGFPIPAHMLAEACDMAIEALSEQTEEVIPHRNYKYLSDYWCACGWHLGKKGEVKYCADCGRKVNWDG